MNQFKRWWSRVMLTLGPGETRDLDRVSRMVQEANEAVRRSRTEPLREIERDLNIDAYAFPSQHTGYAFHERNVAAHSRSEEQRRFDEVERRFSTEIDPLVEDEQDVLVTR